MATPLYDDIDMRVSRALEDPVSYTAGGGAATAGKVYTVAQRQELINRANVYLQSFLYNKFDTDGVKRILQSTVKTASITFASAGTSVASDYNNMPIGLTKDSSTATYVYVQNKLDADNDVNKNLSYIFTVEAGKIYVYIRSAGTLTKQSSGTGVFYYLASDQVTQNSATDILLSRQFWDVLRDLAVWFALTEKPDPNVKAPPQMFYDRAMAFLQMLK